MSEQWEPKFIWVEGRTPKGWHYYEGEYFEGLDKYQIDYHGKISRPWRILTPDINGFPTVEGGYAETLDQAKAMAAAHARWEACGNFDQPTHPEDYYS